MEKIIIRLDEEEYYLGQQIPEQLKQIGIGGE